MSHTHAEPRRRPSARGSSRPSRRELLSGAAGVGLAAAGWALAGCAGSPALPGGSGPDAAERPPETTAIRLPVDSTLCQAPVDLAEELLKGEGFTDVQRVSYSD